MSANQIAKVKAKDAHDKKALIDRSNATKTAKNNEIQAVSGFTSNAGKGLFALVRRWMGM